MPTFEEKHSISNEKDLITTRHISSKCPKIEELDKKCVALTKTFTNEQTTEFQQLINEAFENNYIDDEQLPQTLEVVLEILEDLIDRGRPMKTSDEDITIVYLPSYIQVAPITKKKNSSLASLEVSNLEDPLPLP
ncbi:702_t:CDS:2 [Ambispora leptoticha]|uniref:702_t:CDS:1 n=1 Tax=Ambispora leptoticha TaxID=144679 RepID=A0A9N9G7Y2_9GLOM|nr:702_t:CDS:2 [Ambispora leptoticha]